MTDLAPGYSLHRAHGLDELSIHTFHDIAKLRQEVFVLEQDCVYVDFDGRDAEPHTLQYWVENEAGEVAATIRVLDESATEPGLRAIGRVATDAAHRGKSLAGALMEAAVADFGTEPLVLHAQSHLTHWYNRFGFVADGDEYLEDGIPHTPMRREAAPPATSAE